ncbi:MAG TPA: hypothetical protein VFC29_20710 [Candidatus Limnocylindrales bacterium]|jgi:hypothetical protein|nr:hypothetical protein [Candidatus Limnocylindrales bacterium]
MSQPQTIAGTLRYLSQAAVLDVPSNLGQATAFLLLMDFPPGGNSIPTQEAAARAFLVNHDHKEGAAMSVYGIPDVVGGQPVIHVIQVS